jgi:peptide/nickel transport system permease protein
VARGDLGESLWTRQAVLVELGRRMPVTLVLGSMAIVVAVLIGVPVGVVAAVRQDGALDFFARSAAILGLSIPAFVKAIVIILLPAIWWGWTPMIRFVDFSTDPVLHVLQFVVPAVILGIASAAAIMRLTRGMLLEVLRQDYVRTAWAKGLRERLVVLKHGLRNAIIPVVTVLGLQVATIASGAVIIEAIFSLPGMGQLLLEAIIQRDYPVIQGVNLVIVTIIVVTNLVVDLLYAAIDPRIRY